MNQRISLAFLVLAAAVLSGGCGEDSAVQPSGLGKIVGKVTRTDGVAIARALVTTSPASQSILTDSVGGYSISNVAPGVYAVVASKDGYNPGTASVSVSAGNSSRADIVLTQGAANQAPAAPTMPSPPDGSLDQPRSLTLGWTCTDPENDTLRYDVYFGKNAPPQLISSGQLENSHSTSNLDSSTTYYWQIVARDSHGGVSSSAVWSFRTAVPWTNRAPGMPSNPIPSDGATSVATSTTISWRCTDPDGDALTFDVFFGTSSNPPLLTSNLSAASISRSGLAVNTRYYWRILAHDAKGGETYGPVWTMTTGSEVITSGLIAFYPFNGNASDESGRGHDGTVQGALLTMDRFGASNSAYRFIDSDRIVVPHAADLNFPGRRMTICAWVRLNGPQSQYAGIVAKGPTRTEYPGYEMVIVDSNKLGTAMGQPGWIEDHGPTSLQDGAWHFVTLAADEPAHRVYLYVDGRLERQSFNSTLTMSFSATNALYIGTERNNSAFFRGSIDDVRLYDRVLSSAEIEQLANS